MPYQTLLLLIKMERLFPLSLNQGVPLWLPQLLGFGGSDTTWFPSCKRWCSFFLISQDTCLLNPVTRWEAQFTCNGSDGEEQSLQYSTQIELPVHSQYQLVIMWVRHLGIWSSSLQLTCHSWCHMQQKWAFPMKPCPICRSMSRLNDFI